MLYFKEFHEKFLFTINLIYPKIVIIFIIPALLMRLQPAQIALGKVKVTADIVHVGKYLSQSRQELQKLKTYTVKTSYARYLSIMNSLYNRLNIQNQDCDRL